jgi:CelD/BcsL family acetyltransferase involved in cellulose biosynthesis
VWWKHYQQSNSVLHLLVVRDAQEQIRGIAPFYLQTTLLQGKVLRLLGGGEVCSDYLTVLTRPQDHAAIAQTIANWLVSHPGAWSRLDLSGTKQDDLALNSLTKSMLAAGCTATTRPDANCWRTELPKNWNDFLVGLSSSRREKIRKIIRRAASKTTITEVRSLGDLQTVFPILIDLHQKRRNSLEQSGCFASPRFAAFHADIAEQMLRDNRLRLRCLYLDGTPAAVEYSFLGSDTLFYYQGGFEPALAEHRPGWLCFALALQSAIEQGYRTFDFLRGDEGYKSSWNATPVPLVRLQIFSTTRVARFRAFAEAKLRGIYEVLKSAWPRRKEASEGDTQKPSASPAPNSAGLPLVATFFLNPITRW